jgi:hypothetical protein
MINRDNVLLENLYLQTLKESSEDVFESEIKLSLDTYSHGGVYDFEYPKSVKVRYRIDIGYRRYGIDGITVQFVDAEKFNVDVLEFDDEGDSKVVKSIPIDLSSLKEVAAELSVGEFGEIYPNELSVGLDIDFNLEHARLVF